MNKKAGFSLVELIIVISVIAVLAGILIPVFANVADDAVDSEAIQNAKSVYTNYAVIHAQDGSLENDVIYVHDEEHVITIVNGSTENVVYESKEAALKALCDDPNTDQDESQNYKLVDSEFEKLFVVVEK